jgi:NADH pyrophosphatase NudC (nudix superfamily)
MYRIKISGQWQWLCPRCFKETFDVFRLAEIWITSQDTKCCLGEQRITRSHWVLGTLYGVSLYHYQIS